MARRAGRGCRYGWTDTRPARARGRADLPAAERTAGGARLGSAGPDDPRRESGAAARHLEPQAGDSRMRRGGSIPPTHRALLGFGIGEVSRPSEIARPIPGRRGEVAARARRVRERRAAMARREHAARDSGDVPRGGAARPRGAERHALPGAHRPGEHLGPGARRTPDERRRARGPRARRPARALSRRRSRPRSALGAHRGDLRRGSVPGDADGRGGRSRLPGHHAAAGRRQGVRHLEALRGARIA